MARNPDRRTHTVGTQEEWEAARTELLKREQELGNLDEEIAKQRSELPWVKVEEEYTFDTEDGTKTLPELFDGRSQLLIYHLMFGPSYEAACPGCTALRGRRPTGSSWSPTTSICWTRSRADAAAKRTSPCSATTSTSQKARTPR